MVVLLDHLRICNRRAVTLSLHNSCDEALDQLSQDGRLFADDSGFTVTRDSFDLALLFLIVVAISWNCSIHGWSHTQLH